MCVYERFCKTQEIHKVLFLFITTVAESVLT